MISTQTLDLTDRQRVAAWAADCAERVLWLFEAERPQDRRPREAIERARAFARGELNVADEIRGRFGDGSTAREVKSPAGVAAARAAGQAMAVCHMGAHALGAAAYAAKAAGLSAFEGPDAAREEIRWQLAHMTPEVRAALRGAAAHRRRPFWAAGSGAACLGATGGEHPGIAGRSRRLTALGYARPQPCYSSPARWGRKSSGLWPRNWAMRRRKL